MADVYTKSPQEILSDPKFLALPYPQQLKVMRTVDPNFAGLPPKQQGTVLFRVNDAAKNPGAADLGKKAEDQGFWKTLGVDALNVVPATASAMLHPIDTLESATAARRALGAKASEAKKEGHPVQAAGYYAASKIPFLGPAAAQAGEEIGNRQYGQGFAHALETVGSADAAARALEKVPVAGETAKNLIAPEGGRISRVLDRFREAYEKAKNPNPPKVPGLSAWEEGHGKVAKQARQFGGENKPNYGSARSSPRGKLSAPQSAVPSEGDALKAAYDEIAGGKGKYDRLAPNQQEAVRAIHEAETKAGSKPAAASKGKLNPPSREAFESEKRVTQAAELRRGNVLKQLKATLKDASGTQAKDAFMKLPDADKNELIKAVNPQSANRPYIENSRVFQEFGDWIEKHWND